MAIYIIRGFLHSWKKCPDMLSEVNAARPVRCDSSLQTVMAVWPLFVWIQTFWIGCDSPLLTIIVRQKAITICRGLSHPTRSLSRIVCRGQERPKGKIGTLRIFLKPMSPQDTGGQLWVNPGIVSLRQFRDNEAWIQLGQESPLMNKKGLMQGNSAVKSLFGFRFKFESG